MQRRLVTITLFVLLLSACKREGEFQSAEVLKRATVANSQLTSAAFTALIGARTAKGPVQLDMKAEFEGSMADAGQHVTSLMTAEGTVLTGQTKSSFTLIMDLVTETRKDVYFMLKELSLDPVPTWAANIQALKGGWWKVPRGAGDSAVTVTPDPKFLHMQAETVTVTKDYGLVKIHDRDAYRYDVAIDPEKLMGFLKASATERGEAFDEQGAREDLLKYDAKGQLWIDADTFVLHRLQWIIVTKDDPDGLRLSIDVDLRKHGEPMQISPPAQAKDLDTNDLLQKMFPAPAAQ